MTFISRLSSAIGRETALMRSFFDLPRLGREVAELLEAAELGDLNPERAESLAPRGLTMQMLRSQWSTAADIAEFAKIAAALRLGSVRVVRAEGYWNECGCCYDAAISSALENSCLICIDDLRLPKEQTLEELFIHELAHVYCGQHDWSFVLCLNLMRLEVGLGPTTDPYDCRDEDSVPATEILRLAAEHAVALRTQYDFSKTGFHLHVPAPYAS